ncbi:zinc-binding dehydrogenase [Bryobacter aggregatus]|uniref:zinc-binding dehydrogenase n=1 Tax=Bryobacter aggregatus TaxID=360054 RepID=UPI0004E1A405|nr:zinc-binding dehydrogenase [Bryobacter aggregatus]
MKMSKAAVLQEYQKPLQICEFPLNEELQPGEALARVEMAGICGTDVHLWKGELPIPVPVILGHESAGRIAKLGAGLERDWTGQALQEGDRVVWASSIVCGECYYCRIKRTPTRCLKRKAYGISYCSNEAPHLRGGYAEWILLRAGTSIFKLPDNLPFESIVGAGCALNTALHGVERIGLEMGDTVVIQGAGPVGLAALAVAIESGAAKTVVVGGPAHRLQMALEFGADAVVSLEEFPTAAVRLEEVRRHTGEFGADVVLECVGHPSAVPEGFELCRDGGKYLVLGQYANAGNVEFNPHVITKKQLTVMGSWAFEPRHVLGAIQFLARPRWRELFAKQVTHRFSLDQASEALDTVRRLEAGKAVILP